MVLKMATKKTILKELRSLCKKFKLPVPEIKFCRSAITQGAYQTNTRTIEISTPKIKVLRHEFYHYLEHSRMGFKKKVKSSAFNESKATDFEVDTNGRKRAS